MTVQMIEMSPAGTACMMRFVISIFAFEFKTYQVLTLAINTSATAKHAKSYRSGEPFDVKSLSTHYLISQEF